MFYMSIINETNIMNFFVTIPYMLYHKKEVVKIL